MSVFQRDYKIRIASPGGDFIVNPGGSVQTWEQISTVISDISYQVENKDIHFLIDWGTAAEYMKAYTSDTIGNYLVAGKLDLPKFLQPQPPLEITCKVQSSQKLSEYYIKYFLFKVFLALNLSSPGCCDFYSASMCVEDDEVTEQLGLSAYIFGDAYELSVKQGWPSMPTIPLLDSWTWLQRVNPDFKRVAQTNVEKALFALLQVCRDGGNLPNPDKLLWLAHAMEALFYTPEAGISKTLRDRIFLVLGSPATHSKEIRKLINSFYEFRSAFVHGRLDIAPPTGLYDFDDEAGRLTSEIIKNMAFATSLIVATLQLLIQKKWRSLEFSEAFRGQSL